MKGEGIGGKALAHSLPQAGARALSIPCLTTRQEGRRGSPPAQPRASHPLAERMRGSRRFAFVMLTFQRSFFFFIFAYFVHLSHIWPWQDTFFQILCIATLPLPYQLHRGFASISKPVTIVSYSIQEAAKHTTAQFRSCYIFLPSVLVHFVAYLISCLLLNILEK